MTEGSLITPELKALLGRERSFTAPEEVGRASIRRFAVAVGDLNPLYLNEGYAKKSKYGGIIAPPTFVCETWQYCSDELLESGSMKELQDMAPPGAEAAIRGGNEYEFFRPLRPDDVITARFKVIDIYEKAGETGKLLFVTRQAVYSNQKGEAIATNTETMIYRFQ